MLRFFALSFLVTVTIAHYHGRPSHYNKESMCADDTLQQVHIVFRHGDRTPGNSITYMNNPHENETYAPYGYGELTLKGKRKAYTLGTILRNRYKRLIGGHYYRDLIQAYACDYRRTQMSLLSVLAGMFPPEKASKLSLRLDWEPIPYSVPCPDKLISMTKTCPNLFSVTTEINDKDTIDIYNFLREHTGQKYNNSFDVSAIHNTMQVQEEFGLKLPDWVKPIWNSKFKKAALQFWLDMTKQHLPDLVGNLLHKIVIDTKSKIAGDIPQKLFLYSGHDGNVASMYAAFDAYFGQYITYSAYVAVEVHKIDDVYGFQVYALNYDTDKAVPLKIPGCDYFCPIDKFEANIVNKLYRGDKWCT